MSKENINQHKRSYCNEEEENSHKKRKLGLKITTVNGFASQRLKKAPRLSPALFNDHCVIPHGSLHQLIKYAVLGKEQKSTQASWCSIHHQKRLQGVVILVLEGLSQHHFYQYYTHFQYLRRLFPHRFSLPPPPSDFIGSVLGLNRDCVKVRTKEEMDSNHLHNNTEDAVDQLRSSSITSLSHDPILQKYGKNRHGLTRYLLSEEEIRKWQYPFIGCPESENYVHTNCTEEPTNSSPLFGLDCEMCLTTRGSELTRVSLVDVNGHCIMDELVMPDNPIKNYLTRFSGITRKMLLPVKTKLKDVQEKLKQLLPPDAVLVGHSLNNDLQALQMIHPYVIDTSLMFAREFGRRFRLKFLAEAVLQKEIQGEQVVGHIPSEDAVAALKLAQYFIENGPEKVSQLNLEEIHACANNILGPEKDEIPEVIQNGLTHSLHAEHTHQASLVHLLEKNGQKIVYISSKDAAKNPACMEEFDCVLGPSNVEVLERASNIFQQSPLTVANYQLGSIFSRCNASTNEKVTCKYAEMRTIVAGPFKGHLGLKSIKMHFQSCGPIHSLCIVSVDGQVQMLMSAVALDYENTLKQMEGDPENKDIIYVAGFMKPLTEAFLQQKFSHFQGIKAIFLPRSSRSQKSAQYCYIKFQTPDSAAVALGHIRTHGGLMCCKAVTSSHLHRWLREAKTDAPSLAQSSTGNIPEVDLAEIIKDADWRMNQLYENLAVNTLCVILFSGNNSESGALPGFGLMEIKPDQVNGSLVI
ncbi:RNA exonuclease 5 isoform X2 [Hyperolius riggenbachi]|uniref:RNA exonuclease 5 isoform X2 n=1 Tax=Hyperolius riggenbachi TaxID=752182 RepID=UPI0035A31696